MTQLRKVAVFGLDGVTFDLLGPFMEEGHLPNLKRLIETGTSGELTSTIPPVSASAWASMATGTNPGQHGLIDFTYPRPDGYQIEVSNRTMRRVVALWDIVSLAGGKVGVVSVPMTFPPKTTNGFIVSSFMAPSQSSSYTSPPELKAEIARTIGEPFPLHMNEAKRTKDPAGFARELADMETKRADAVLHLMQTKPWDFFMYVVESTDNLQHEVWHILDPTHPRHDPAQAEAARGVILDYYDQVDVKLGEMLDAVPDDTLVIVLSDHGFGPFLNFFHVNNWLVRAGYLRIKRGGLSGLKYLLFKLGFTPLNLARVVTQLGLSGLRQHVKRGRGQGMLRRLFLSFNDVDWARTKAFSVGNFGQVYLNVKGRRPKGAIDPGDAYEALRDELVEAALALRDPKTGEKVIQAAYRSEEVFHGRAFETMPDLILHTDRAKYVSFGHADFGSGNIIEPSFGQTGHHHMQGIVVLRGPDVRAGTKLEGATLLDVAPTVLYAMGLPVPRYMDGTVLEAAFQPGVLTARPVTFSDDDGDISRTQTDIYSEEDEAEIMQRLRDLGYVG